MNARKTMKTCYREWIDTYRNISQLYDGGMISNEEQISLEERLLDRIIEEVQKELE